MCLKIIYITLFSHAMRNYILIMRSSFIIFYQAGWYINGKKIIICEKFIIYDNSITTGSVMKTSMRSNVTKCNKFIYVGWSDDSW